MESWLNAAHGSRVKQPRESRIVVPESVGATSRLRFPKFFGFRHIVPLQEVLEVGDADTEVAAGKLHGS
jgi:hypothetical protein